MQQVINKSVLDFNFSVFINNMPPTRKKKKQGRETEINEKETAQNSMNDG